MALALIVSSVGATVAVGIVLLAVTMGWIDLGFSTTLVRACDVLAIGLLARAVGQFRDVGVFKRIRDRRFARPDSYVCSPICMLLGLATGFVANSA